MLIALRPTATNWGTPKMTFVAVLCVTTRKRLAGPTQRRRLARALPRSIRVKLPHLEAMSLPTQHMAVSKVGGGDASPNGSPAAGSQRLVTKFERPSNGD